MNSKKASVARKEELAKIFKMAIKAEQRAQKMYQHALLQCDGEDIRAILIAFREDEERHEKEIALLYKELVQFFAVKDGLEGKSSTKKTYGGGKKKSAT